MIGTDIWNILFWIFVGIALGGLLSWLLGASTKSTTEVDRFGVADLEGRHVTVREERTELADQLEAIEGVGPKITELFHKNGVFRFAQVAAMAPADITKILHTGGSDFDIARPYTWPFQARLLENGWIAEFLGVKEKLRAGRLRLHGVEGIGEPTAERLHALNIGSVPALAEANAAEVTARLAETGEVVTEGNVASWIEQAKRLHIGDMALLAAFFGLSPSVLKRRTGLTYKDHRDVMGPIVEANSLSDLFTTTATATARPSLLPFWLGLGGAALMALLSSLMGHPKAPEAAPVASAPTVLSTELGADTLFATDSAVLTDAGKAEIESKIIEPAKGHDVASVRVVGHADVRADDAYNLNLSKERAAAVAAYMKDRAVAEGINWNARTVQVFGAGEEFPNPNANTTEDCASFREGDASKTPEASTCFAPDRRVDVDIITAAK